jgi:uncharacterized protein with PIN domain
VTKHAELRFYAELRDFLSADRRSGLVTRTFDVAGSVKDMIEACGVPHTEVAVILANGEAVDFSYRVRDGDHIAVYPPFRVFEIEPAQLVSPAPLQEPRFVLDGHLGKLARYLRLLGFDSTYDVAWTDPELIVMSTGETRALLTRDVGLLMHAKLTHGYFVRATDPRTQVTEVARRFDLAPLVDAFTRCMACNGILAIVEKEKVVDRLPPRTRERHDEFQTCLDCGRIYWQGSHHAQLQEVVAAVTGVQPASSASSSRGVSRRLRQE